MKLSFSAQGSGSLGFGIVTPMLRTPLLVAVMLRFTLRDKLWNLVLSGAIRPDATGSRPVEACVTAAGHFPGRRGGVAWLQRALSRKLLIF